MEKQRAAIYISSSISNWRDKLKRRFALPEWHWLKSSLKPAIFFGMYNNVDYYRFLWHRGKKTIFWCGSDILNLQKRPRWQAILRVPSAKHIVENEIERKALLAMGIKSCVYPCLFDTTGVETISFVPNGKPHVYVCAHRGKEKEYGIDMILEVASREALEDVTFHIYGVDGLSEKNVVYHGLVPSAQFDEEIRNYQAGLRLNEFDGFSEVLAKSVLMGQFPISRIQYPHISHFNTKKELVRLLRNLKNKKKPNYEAREWWLKHLARSLNEIVR